MRPDKELGIDREDEKTKSVKRVDETDRAARNGRFEELDSQINDLVLMYQSVQELEEKQRLYLEILRKLDPIIRTCLKPLEIELRTKREGTLTIEDLHSFAREWVRKKLRKPAAELGSLVTTMFAYLTLETRRYLLAYYGPVTASQSARRSSFAESLATIQDEVDQIEESEEGLLNKILVSGGVRSLLRKHSARDVRTKSLRQANRNIRIVKEFVAMYLLETESDRDLKYTWRFSDQEMARLRELRNRIKPKKMSEKSLFSVREVAWILGESSTNVKRDIRDVTALLREAFNGKNPESTI